MSNPQVAEDPRIDPRIKALLAALQMSPTSDATSREEMLEKANSARAHWSPCKDDAPRSAVASGTRAARAAGA